MSPGGAPRNGAGALLVCIAGLAFSSCVDPFGIGACTLIGCTNGAHIKVNRVLDPSDADDATVTACWNTTCASGRLLPPIPGQGSGRSVSFEAGGLFTTAVLWTRAVGRELELDIEVRRELGAPFALEDGDVYAVRVVSAAGTTLVDGRKSVAYTDAYPNGRDCDDQPCRFAVFEIP